MNIVQTQASHRHGSLPLPQFTANAATGLVQWNASSGTFSPSLTTSGAPTIYTPINRTEQVLISAQDSLGSQLTVIQIFGTFPDRGNYKNVGIKIADRVNKSVAEDEGESDVIKGEMFQSFTYSFPANARRDLAHFEAVEAFWLWHRKGKHNFFIEDPQTDDLFHFVRCDSELQSDGIDNNMIGFSAVFIEV